MPSWGIVLKDWLVGRYPKYPARIKSRFFFETSVCSRDLKSPYQAEFVITNAFDRIGLQPDFAAFDKLINANTSSSSAQKYALAFANLDGSSILIIPVPKQTTGGGTKGFKNFMTIRDFMDSASDTQQQEFWKTVAREIIKYLETHELVWVSTHGLGVPYFHLRLDPKPKYYKTTKFTTGY